MSEINAVSHKNVVENHRIKKVLREQIIGRRGGVE